MIGCKLSYVDSGAQKRVILLGMHSSDLVVQTPYSTGTFGQALIQLAAKQQALLKSTNSRPTFEDAFHLERTQTHIHTLKRCTSKSGGIVLLFCVAFDEFLRTCFESGLSQDA